MKSVASPKSTFSYFKWALIATFLGLACGAALGWQLHGTLSGMVSLTFICAVLAVLEISLSFDNAIVNANKLKTMRPEWQRRFLTWGIVIAVFGMRLVFPLLVVVIAAKLGPLDALRMAAREPDHYARIMRDAHLPIAAFGGTFLSMVALSFFFDSDKEIHWINWLEKRLCSYASIRGMEIAVVMVIVMAVSRLMAPYERGVFIESAIWGLLAFLGAEILGYFLDPDGSPVAGAARGGFGAFVYLEILDASFSFDGVIGAFALSTNLYVIAIGLGIGAMYVRSLTIMLVEKGTLQQYRFLEHGAFYAILILAVLMFLQTLMHVPEWLTGLGGAALIGIALWSSIRWQRGQPDKV